MTYLINNEISFRSDDGVMASIAAPENTVVLSITATRIFTYLLEQKGKIVTRDDIFVNVWDKNGLQASNNSLSQYISLIRRSLHDLGCVQEVIQTIPRVGFLIPEGLAVECDQEKRTQPQRDFPPPESKITVMRPVAVKYIVAGALAASLALIFIPLSSLNGETSASVTSVETWKLGDIGRCPVYTFYKNSPELASVKLKQAQKLAHDYLGCIDGATFYFQPDDLYVYGESGRVFLSRCTWSNKEKTTVAGCKDIYIHEH